MNSWTPPQILEAPNGVSNEEAALAAKLRRVIRASGILLVADRLGLAPSHVRQIAELLSVPSRERREQIAMRLEQLEPRL